MRLSTGTLKSAVRSALQRIGLRHAAAPHRAHELRQIRMDLAFDFFAEMSGQPGIAGVAFEPTGAIVTLEDGRRYHFEMANKAARLYSIPFTGTFEPIETQFVRQTVKPGDVCFDIGASFGWYTMLLSKAAGPRGRVHAFEPIPQTAALLRRNVELNGATNVTVQQLALDETHSQRDLYIADIGVSGSFMPHACRSGHEKFSAQAITLDSYVRDHKIQRLDFLKADIEGAEWAALKGGIETLRRFQPTLMVEVQAGSTRLFGHEPADVFAWLAEIGYRPFAVQPSGELAAVEDVDAPMRDYNFIFQPMQRAEAKAA